MLQSVALFKQLAVLKLLIVSYWFTSLLGCAQDQAGDQKTGKIFPTSSEVEVSWKAPYPAHWWRVSLVRESDGLERLPHQAGDQEVVLSQRNEFRQLHYGYPQIINFENRCFGSVLEVLDEKKAWDIMTQRDLFDLLVEVNMQKVLQKPALRELLLKTQGLTLLSDSYDRKTSLQHYYLPEVWMRVRELIQNNSQEQFSTSGLCPVLP